MVKNELIEVDNALEVKGARVHNLKNLDISIPRNKLVVITGLSGSGKSSLAFDTIYAEGQRRYIESFAAYARQFLGKIERPDVDKITGLSPVISIEQKTISKNPRSTVGTITEIYDFLRLLFSKVATAYSYVTNEPMVKYTDQQIVQLIIDQYQNKQVHLLAPIVKGRKGHYRELFEQIRKKGFLRVRVDEEIREIKANMQLDRYKTHDIELVIDRILIKEEETQRISESVKTALTQGKGILMVHEEESNETRFYSRNLMCPTSGIAYDEPAPNFFSFNSPYGACKKCNGLGEVSNIDLNKVIPDRSKNIYRGGLAPLGDYKQNWIFGQIEAIGKTHGFTLKTPIEDIPEESLNIILFGTDEAMEIESSFGSNYSLNFEGVINFITRQYEEAQSKTVSRWAFNFMNKTSCPDCNGSRIRKESRHFKIGGKNISDLATMDIIELSNWFEDVEKHINEDQQIIARDVIKEVRKRLRFILEVGLDYLTLNRSSRTLSGGEAQRIRLATQIGSKLVGVLYILDEPSIGLHQRDNDKLIQALKELVEIGNSVFVVEHDKEIMMASDHIIDIGPHAGVHGGRIVAEGSPQAILKQQTITANYLSGRQKIELPKTRRKAKDNQYLSLTEASGNNLKKVDLHIPIGCLTCITGVSGSGKSTLINGTLYPILNQHFYKSVKKPLPYKKMEGIGLIDKVIEIDQAPIGRTPRSNPATYTDVFSDIRNLYSQLPEAKIRGYKPGRFSFNVKGGRCESCQGAGVKVIEMNFLPDVHVECSTCNGKRYNRETLEVRYRGKNIGDVLNMTIEHAVQFFENIPKIVNKIKTLESVGLGYVRLGQPSTTLSGGEAQRIKLAAELSKKATGQTLYILDEPTTGLHFEDIRILLNVISELVDRGNTVVIIEHNLDIVKVADHIIDLGPEGGERGGQIIATGTPEEIVRHASESYTAHYLKSELE
jgi:excinuclease ABC subunit A